MSYPTHRVHYFRGPNDQQMHVVLYTIEGRPLVCGVAPVAWPFKAGEVALQLSPVDQCDHGGTYDEPDRWGHHPWASGRRGYRALDIEDY